MIDDFRLVYDEPSQSEKEYLIKLVTKTNVGRQVVYANEKWGIVVSIADWNMVARC